MNRERSAASAHIAFALLAVAIVVADQWTKAAIVEFFAARGVTLPATGRIESVPALGGLFGLRIQENTGGAFGVFGGSSTVSAALVATSALALAFIGWYYWMYRESAWMRVALACVAGGAVGNLIDRVRLKYVVDFIDVDIGSYQWPYFNLADTFICIGAGMLMIFLWRDRTRSRTESANESV